MGKPQSEWEEPPWGKKKSKKRTKDKKTFSRGQNFMVKMSLLTSYHLHSFESKEQKHHSADLQSWKGKGGAGLGPAQAMLDLVQGT